MMLTEWIVRGMAQPGREDYTLQIWYIRNIYVIEASSEM